MSWGQERQVSPESGFPFQQRLVRVHLREQFPFPFCFPSSHSSPRALSTIPFQQREKHLWTSWGQFLQVSPGLISPFQQWGSLPELMQSSLRSAWQERQVSPGSIFPFQHRGEGELVRVQETEHLLFFQFCFQSSQISPGSIFPFQQVCVEQIGTSLGQFVQFSADSLFQFPQKALHAPISWGQFLQVSPASIFPFQQERSQLITSWGQFLQVSPGDDFKLQQIEVHYTTSSVQERQVSPSSIFLSQHLGAWFSHASQIPLLLRSAWSLL